MQHKRLACAGVLEPSGPSRLRTTHGLGVQTFSVTVHQYHGG